MPPVKSKRTKIDMGEMSEEEDDGPTIAKKRMLEERLIHLTEAQTSPKSTATGLIRIRRERNVDDISDPPIRPFTAVVETVRLVVHDTESRSQKACDQRTESSGRTNFKAFVRKGRREMNCSQTSASPVSLVECKLKSYDRAEYQVMNALSVRMLTSLSSPFSFCFPICQTLDNDRDRDSDE